MTIDEQLRQIEILCRRPVREMLAGEYHSVFKGRGLEFDEVRGYQVGDDVRLIDWNVTARTGQPHVKRFVEERQLSIYLVVDVSGSQEYGSSARTKRHVAAELCGLLAYSANHNNDRTGLLLFSDSVERYLPPRKSRSHVMRLLHELLTLEPRERKTSIRSAIEYLSNVAGKPGVVFIISDFLDEGYRDELSTLACRHDVITICLRDRRERDLPKTGIVRFRDLESGGVRTVDLGVGAGMNPRVSGSSFGSRQDIERTPPMRGVSDFEEMQEWAQLHGIDHVNLTTDEDCVERLVEFFKRRERRLADETGG